MNKWLSLRIQVGEEIVLRPLTLDDTASYFALLQDCEEELQTDISGQAGAENLDEVAKRISQKIRLFADGWAFDYGIFFGGRLVGMIGNGGYNGLHLNPEQSVSLYYFLTPLARGRGITRRVVESVVNDIFTHTSYRGVVAEILPENLRSINLVVKLGFEYLDIYHGRRLYAKPRPGLTVRDLHDLCP